jgi:hypothetical protein
LRENEKEKEKERDRETRQTKRESAGAAEHDRRRAYTHGCREGMQPGGSRTGGLWRRATLYD